MLFYCNSCNIDHFCKPLVIIKVVKEFHINFIVHVDIPFFLNWFVIGIVFFLFVKKYKTLVGVLL